MVQVPAATSVTVEPVASDAVHTAPVCELKLTGNPELALALTVIGDALSTWLASAANAIVCATCTWKLWFTGAAAAYVAFPPCVAWRVHAPAVTSVTVEPVAPETVHTAPVCELKLTGTPELALALTVIGDALVT